MRCLNTVSLATLAMMSAAPYSQGATTPVTAEQRAAKLVDAMTLEEQISLLRPVSGASLLSLGVPLPDTLPESMRQPKPDGAIGSAGFVPGISRLGMPSLQESDASLGVADIGYLRPGDFATALPSTLSLAAGFDPDLARQAGRMVGAEAHAKGLNVQLAGGVNLARELRNGRNFEYFGEDPLLAGTLAGQQVAGIQDEHVVSTVKHFAVNSQETGRLVHDARIGESAARESDLLAFEIAIQTGKPGSVMCAYNKIDGDFACENAWLLRDVLKHDWQYKGWVMSDWGAVHSLLPSLSAGLDQQSPQDEDYFGGLSQAVAKGEIPRAKVRDMAYRIVRSLYAVGAIDNPPAPGGKIDQEAHAAMSRRVAEQGSVLLKNDGVLPLTATAKTIVVIGGHADIGVLEGGGSSQVNAYGGLYRETGNLTGLITLIMPAYIKSSPLHALEAIRPDAKIIYDDGSDPARAAALAANADVAIVFAVKPEIEGIDTADFRLPGQQDSLISAIAFANPKTVVVLETGNPVAMPWLNEVAGVLEAWFPGQRGGEAIANILTGRASPSGRLPMTFPRSTGQLPRPIITGYDPAKERALSIGVTFDPFAIDYSEGSDVGYRWFEKTSAKPLFPFGYGLTYTQFSYSNLKSSAGATLKVSFQISNTGRRDGTEVAQLYVAPPGRTHRLVGWAKVSLKPGETRTVTINADPRLLLSYDEAKHQWQRPAGDYDFYVGKSADEKGLPGKARLIAFTQSAQR